jgi:hypothetical protein
MDLHANVEMRLLQLSWVTSLRVNDLSEDECNELDEGTSSSFSQGVSINDGVAIFLDWWGWGRPHGRYSFAVFEKNDGQWQQVQARIENLGVAVACAIHALAEQTLLASGAHARS